MRRRHKRADRFLTSLTQIISGLFCHKKIPALAQGQVRGFLDTVENCLIYYVANIIINVRMFYHVFNKIVNNLKRRASRFYLILSDGERSLTAIALVDFSKETQFIIITHNRNTVQAADVIYGITMGRDSASQIISLRLDQVTDDMLKRG